MGSKRRLADQILRRFPPHTTYVEAFAGSAAVLFARPEPAKVEVLNDVDGEITNFFRVCKHHLVELCQQFRWAITSRKMFEWTKETPPEVLTDIQRAARFFYLQRLCFGGKPNGRTFGYGVETRHTLNLARLEEHFSGLHERLAGVVIESLSWRECLARYDREGTLFYLDPPYLGTAGYGGETWELEHYEAIAIAIASLKGKALVSINDLPEIRRTFRGLSFDRLSVAYTVGGMKAGAEKKGELLFRTF
jgi:DNA adenine methylase